MDEHETQCQCADCTDRMEEEMWIQANLDIASENGN